MLTLLTMVFQSTRIEVCDAWSKSCRVNWIIVIFKIIFESLSAFPPDNLEHDLTFTFQGQRVT